MPNPAKADVNRPEQAKTEFQQQFHLFATLMALGSLIAVWQRMAAGQTDVLSSALQVIIAAAAMWALLKTMNPLPVIVISTSHVLHALVNSPQVTSADVSWMFFGGVLCISYLTGCLKKQGWNISSLSLLRDAAPTLRMGTVLVIVAVAVARWNWSFLHLESSPVAETLALWLAGRMPPNGAVYGLTSMLLCVDLFIAVALFVPSLRRFGAGFGSFYLATTAVLGLGNAAEVLPVLLVGLFLFTSTELSRRIVGSCHRLIPVPRVRNGLLPVSVGIVMFATLVLEFSPQIASRISSQHLARSYTLGVVLIWLCFLLVSLVDERPKLTWVGLVTKNPAHWAWLICLLTTAASPYLGLGTRGRFVEGSRLDTLGDHNNHLFLPNTQLLPDRSVAIEIEHSNDPYLGELSETSQFISWFELVNYLSERPDTSLQFVRHGERFAVERAGEIEEFSSTNGWILRKLVSYRPVRRRSLAPTQVAAAKDP